MVCFKCKQRLAYYGVYENTHRHVSNDWSGCNFFEKRWASLLTRFDYHYGIDNCCETVKITTRHCYACIGHRLIAVFVVVDKKKNVKNIITACTINRMDAVSDIKGAPKGRGIRRLSRWQIREEGLWVDRPLGIFSFYSFRSI